MSARLRPRFRLRVDVDADAVMDVFRRHKEGGAPCILHLYEHQVEFSVLPKDRHFWSPFLNLIVETEGSETRLYGKYGPNVNVWTMFTAAYAVLLLSGLGGFFVGTSQLMIHQPASGLWVSLGCAVAMALVYGIGRFGRLLAHPQMLVFHEFIESAFGEHVLELRDEEAD